MPLRLTIVLWGPLPPSMFPTTSPLAVSITAQVPPSVSSPVGMKMRDPSGLTAMLSMPLGYLRSQTTRLSTRS